MGSAGWFANSESQQDPPARIFARHDPSAGRLEVLREAFCYASLFRQWTLQRTLPPLEKKIKNSTIDVPLEERLTSPTTAMGWTHSHSTWYSEEQPLFPVT